MDACDGIGSDDERSEHRASQRVVASRCTRELRSGIKVRGLVLRQTIKTRRSERVIGALEVGPLECMVCGIVEFIT
uniref:Uncharacterized protein n=1 Tax=Physcomitrium patens TaxID=3218 RepID=A0A2K1I9K1_PHYPA|nr:hypothetical protein PHYPA_031280 [Physcomitrium patens]PNR53286.1 hypothetical protein PHYPA_009662 [Physcomitrium patens]